MFPRWSTGIAQYKFQGWWKQTELKISEETWWLGLPRSSLIHLAYIRVAPPWLVMPPAKDQWPVKEEQLQCWQHGSNLVTLNSEQPSPWACSTRVLILFSTVLWVCSLLVWSSVTAVTWSSSTLLPLNVRELLIVTVWLRSYIGNMPANIDTASIPTTESWERKLLIISKCENWWKKANSFYDPNIYCLL